MSAMDSDDLERRVVAAGGEEFLSVSAVEYGDYADCSICKRSRARIRDVRQRELYLFEDGEPAAELRSDDERWPEAESAVQILLQHGAAICSDCEEEAAADAADSLAE